MTREQKTGQPEDRMKPDAVARRTAELMVYDQLRPSWVEDIACGFLADEREHLVEDVQREIEQVLETYAKAEAEIIVNAVIYCGEWTPVGSARHECCRPAGHRGKHKSHPKPVPLSAVDGLTMRFAWLRNQALPTALNLIQSPVRSLRQMACRILMC